MDSKIYLSQLAKTLAKKKHIPQKDAETFLKEFFDAIIQNVTAAGAVKVKGLGTFKLIEVLDRESVDVSTGERIVIPGHTKLSFAPDTSLKELVNKPFADFQTVIINEGTNLEEMEQVPEETQTSPLPLGGEPELEPEPEVEPKPKPEPEPAEKPEPISEPEPAKEPEPEPEADPEPVPLASEKVRAMTAAEKWALTLGVILLCVISYFLGYHHVFDSLTVVPQKQEIKTEAPAPKKRPAKKPVVKKDTVPAVPVAPVAQEQVEEPLPPKAEPTRLLLDASKKYRIVDTRGTHVMKPGDYLTRIALREYGNKDFSRYIVSHNKFPNPDNIPVGKEILLPELEEIK